MLSQRQNDMAFFFTTDAQFAIHFLNRAFAAAALAACGLATTFSKEGICLYVS